jgi:signal peptidase I
MDAQPRMYKQTRPEFSVTKGSDLPLSGRSLVAILRAVLDKGAPARFQAKGFSMSPFIKNKDVVTISPLKGKRPGLGEIIAFVHKETDGLCIHRIVRKEGAFYITQGDNTPDTAEIVPAENILGCVSKVEREGKQVFLGLGPERYLIAHLGRRGLLFPLLLPIWRVVRPIFKRTSF